MKIPELPCGQLVASAFVAAIGVVVLMASLLSDLPTIEEQCGERCAELNRRGRVVPTFPPEQSAAMRGKGPKRCECY